MTSIEAKTLHDLGAPFFGACARGELILPRCDDCSRFFFYPTVLCQHCHSPNWSWTPSGGHGVIYSLTVVHRPLVPELQAPYVVAVVKLDEGIRMMTNIVDAEPQDVTIGQRVEVTFGVSWNGRSVPFFRPDTSS